MGVEICPKMEFNLPPLQLGTREYVSLEKYLTLEIKCCYFRKNEISQKRSYQYMYN